MLPVFICCLQVAVKVNKALAKNTALTTVEFFGKYLMVLLHG